MATVINIRPWIIPYMSDMMLGWVDTLIDKYLDYRLNNINAPLDEHYEDRLVQIDRRIAIGIYSTVICLVTLVTLIIAGTLGTKKISQ